MKRNLSLLTCLLLVSLVSFAALDFILAGGPKCGPGYCFDNQGGCSPCKRNLSLTPLSDASPTTPTGIPLDTSWKKDLYAFAQKNVVHPSWGLAHSERDYRVATILADKEGFKIDEDVLFAASFLHDIGGLAPFKKDGVDHAVRSVEVIEPLLTDWGFPMGKWPQVKEMILSHTYYGPAPTSLPAQAFRDADVLDFLGSIGVARILAVTQEEGFANGTLKPTVDTLKSFAKTMRTKCLLQACKELAQPRESEMLKFLSELDQESFQGRAL